jgi:predicted TIM-barrel fold metal-dependent hydrolase
MFGSDSPWLDQAEQVENVQRFELSGRDRELILYDNARWMIDCWRETASRNHSQTGE